MKIAVFGAGSLGSALAGMLARNNDVSIIGRREHVQAVNKHGLRMLGSARGKSFVKAFTDTRGVESPELLIISTKAYDTRRAVEQCSSWLGPDALVLTLQNGLGNIEALRQWRGSRAFAGTTTMGACMVSPGVVRISGLGVTQIGLDSDEAGASRIVDAFRSSGLCVSITRDIMRAVWSKAMVSASINPLTALLRVPNGKLLQSEGIRALMKEVCAESETVARSTGLRFAVGSSYRRALEVARDTAKNTSSMLQDVQLGRKTEIAHINGEIARTGGQYGIQTPLNSLLVAMVEGLERTRRVEKG